MLLSPLLSVETFIGIDIAGGFEDEAGSLYSFYIISVYITHINPLMFDVIDDKPEDVARAHRARVYTLSHQS